MDRITILALQAIVHGLHRGGTITAAAVADIVVQLERSAAERHAAALDTEGARQLMALAAAIEADAAAT